MPGGVDLLQVVQQFDNMKQNLEAADQIMEAQKKQLAKMTKFAKLQKA